MDCVRVSEREIKGKYWDGYHYKELLGAGDVSVDNCRQLCVSDIHCQAWKWEPEESESLKGICSVTYLLKGPFAKKKIDKNKDSRSGLVRCENTWSMLKYFMYLLLIFFILGFFFFILFVCPKLNKPGRIKPLKF